MKKIVAVSVLVIVLVFFSGCLILRSFVKVQRGHFIPTSNIL